MATIINREVLRAKLDELMASEEALNALEDAFTVAEYKNQEYQGAWEVTGLITSLADVIDKAYRVNYMYNSKGELKGQSIAFSKKFRGIIIDMIVRALMILIKKDALETEHRITNQSLVEDVDE